MVDPPAARTPAVGIVAVLLRLVMSRLRKCHPPAWNAGPVAASQTRRYLTRWATICRPQRYRSRADAALPNRSFRRDRVALPASAAGRFAHGGADVAEVHQHRDQRDERDEVGGAGAIAEQRAEAAADDGDGEPGRLGELVGGRERGGLARRAVHDGPPVQRHHAPIQHPVDPPIDVVDQVHVRKGSCPHDARPPRTGRIRAGRSARSPYWRAQALVVRRVVVRLAGAAFAGVVDFAGAASAAGVFAAGFASVTVSRSSSDLTGLTTRSFTVSMTTPAACSATPSALATWSFFFRSV